MTDLVRIEKGIRDRLVEHQALVDSLLREKEQIRGSLFSRFAVCGKPNCVCAQGEKHGPYYVLSNRSAGEGTFVYLREEQVGRVRELLSRHKRFNKGLKRLKRLSSRLHELFARYASSATMTGFKETDARRYNINV